MANNASQLFKTADVGAKDRIARLIYLNVTVDDQKVVSYQMREPFKTLLKTYEFLSGRQEATDLELLEPLANSILQHWSFEPLAEEFSDLEKLFAPAYNLAYEY